MDIKCGGDFLISWLLNRSSTVSESARISVNRPGMTQKSLVMRVVSTTTTKRSNSSESAAVCKTEEDVSGQEHYQGHAGVVFDILEVVHLEFLPEVLTVCVKYYCWLRQLLLMASGRPATFFSPPKSLVSGFVAIKPSFRSTVKSQMCMTQCFF